MRTIDLFFRMASYARHFLTSRHTMGYGIHSPHLFYIARTLVPEDAQYYCYERVEVCRRRFLHCPDWVEVEDRGTGQSGLRCVRDIARTSLKDRKSAQLLFRLANFYQAERIVELGTSLGVTTAYLALPHASSRVVTFEGSKELLKQAQTAWIELELSNIEPILGNIDDTLPAWAAKQEEGSVDMAFMDANHTEEATMRYFQTLLPLLHDGSIVVVDDIRYSPQMYNAWQRMYAHERVYAAMDLGGMGILFFDPHYMKQMFRIRM